MIKLLEAFVDLCTIFSGDVASVHDQLVQVGDAAVLFGGSVDPVTFFAFLVAFGAIVCNVPFEIFSWQLKRVACIAFNDLERTLFQMFVKVASSNRWRATTVRAVLQSIPAIVHYVVFELGVWDSSFATIINTAERCSHIQFLYHGMQWLSMIERVIACST